MEKHSNIDLNGVWDKAIASDPGNLDLKYARDIFLNASQQQMLDAFSRSVIERADELRFMPDHLFNYYFHYFNEYVLSKKYDSFDYEMIVDCYLALLKSKLDSHSINASHPLTQTRETLDFLEKNIFEFNNAQDIYGDLSRVLAVVRRRFAEILNKIGSGQH